MCHGAPVQSERTERAVVYRETELGPAEFAVIQEIIDRASQRTALGAAASVCERFGWRRPNGEPATKSCGVFLRRMAAHGLLRLSGPRPKTGAVHADADREAMLRALGPIPGLVECQPLGPLEVRPVEPEEWDGFRLHMDRYHYLGFKKPVGESLCYIATVGHDLVALLVWGAAVLHCRPRDRFIGWDAATKARRLPFVANNRRFLILPWIRQPHLASRILGANLRRLSRDWRQTYGHPVFLAETFVDLKRFRGTCYRASNWRFLGETEGFSRTAQRGFAANHRPKAAFVFPLHRRALNLLRLAPAAA